MTVWDQVIATALVGTDRRPPDDHALDDMGIPATTDQQPEHVLLSQVAVLAARRAAGRLPVAAKEPPKPAPVDPRPRCSARATQVLELALQDYVPGAAGPVHPVLSDWMDAAARAGRRPPARLVPALLDLGTRRRELRDPVIAITGPLGRWLATRNPLWQRLTESAVDVDIADAEDRLQTGSRAERENALAVLRERDPGHARDLLTANWSKETATERTALLATLSIGLSADDEPFLETVLDDRAKAVRTVAAELLEQLPTSRRANRMAERLEPLVTVSPKLEIAFADEPDQAGRRDGMTNTPPPRIGTRAWWLIQLVTGTPLSWWPAKTGMTPAQLVQGNPGDAVLLGWARAAERQRDAEWARLLFARHRSAALLKAIPAAEAAVLAETAMASTTEPKWPVISALLDAVPGPWPESLSRVAIERYRQADPLSIQVAARLLAARLNPTVAPLVDKWATDLSDYRARREVRSLHHSLTLRKTIAEEFA